MNNFYWINIISFNGSQNNAFEELVCQLAEKESFKNKQDFIKNGNPDGGVECDIILNNKKEICFQAKWFLSTPQKSQWKQIKESFETALKKYPNMITYYIAIPLDRANPRNSTKLSFMDRWNINTKKWKKFAKSEYNRNVDFVYWGSFELFKKLNHKENEDIKNTFFPPSLTSNEILFVKKNYLFDINYSFKKYKIIDLFAGIGGTRLGFQNSFREKANFIFTSEIDKNSQKTYFENYKIMPFGDIKNIDEKSIAKFDILLASSPYQSFSIVKGFSTIEGTLFFDIIRIVKYHKPQVLFLENLKALVVYDKGNTYRIIIETLEELGYKVFSEVLNAKNFGVPQNRERLYIIAFLDHSIAFEFPKPLSKIVKVGDILEEYVDDKYTLSNEQWKKCKELKEKRNFVYKIYNRESNFTHSILASYFICRFSILIEQVAKNPRKLSPKEVAKLQGFPDSFRIDESDLKAYRQFGNSSTVTVVEALAKNILEVLDK